MAIPLNIILSKHVLFNQKSIFLACFFFSMVHDVIVAVVFMQKQERHTRSISTSIVLKIIK